MEVSDNEEITNEDLALFKDALSGEESNNVEVKIYAVRRIAAVAKALEPQRTRDELLDYLATQIDSLEEEVLLCLCEELELFLPLVGGPDYTYELLSILLKISRSVDETLVRNRAVEAIKKLLAEIDQQLTQKYLISSIIDIDDNVWFSEKCSTLSLIPVCYPKANHENKAILRQKYCQIYDDNSALIRKLAAAGLPDFIEVLEIEHVLKDVLPILDLIKEEDQDCVKVNAIDICLTIARKSRNGEIRNDMLQIIQNLSKDKSWKIRQRVALLIDRMVQTFEDEEFVGNLFDIYEVLVIDENTEVSRFKNPKQKFEEVFLEKCMPILMALITDDSDEVQIALSSKIILLSTIISDGCFKNNILPIIISGLEKDKPLLFKENLLKNLDYLPDDVDLIEAFTSLNKIVQHILVTSETSWRTRRSLLITFVHDKVFAVRRTATLILPILAKRFGANWLVNEMTPHLHVILNDDKYLLRYIILFSIQELINPSIDIGKEKPMRNIWAI
ncbi:hypothetical protein HHI36_007326 [Cryptolaemus montrouzieri]|uniref:Protein phosphatase PP2A regulatory subunit A n=1 Tax=Cryptolaemus montrouzieri TaxID=559131 RepID=A0ABD2MP73_9CUCU